MSIGISVILFYNQPRKWLDHARESYYQQETDFSTELIEINKPQSTAKNLNEGFRQARGKYVKYLCDDDLLLPFGLQRLYDHAEMTGADVVCAGALNHSEDSGIGEMYFSHVPDTVFELADHNTIHGGTVLFKRDAILSVGLLDESLNYGEEYDLYLRLAIAGFKFSELNETVYLYRIHKDMKSMQAEVRSGEDYIKRKREILHRIQQKYQGYRLRIKK